MVLHYFQAPKKGQDTISHDVIDNRAVIHKDLDHFPQIAVEQNDHLFRGHVCSKGSESPQICHYYGDLVALASHV